MNSPRVVVRLGEPTNDGLQITTELLIAFVDAPQPDVSPPPLDAQFVNLLVPSVALPSLTSASFLTANTPDESSERASTSKKRKPRHPLVALQAAPGGGGNNMVLLLDKTLHLTVDRTTFHTLGIPSGRPSSRNSYQRLISLPLPLKEGSRAQQALAPPRTTTVDMVLSCGSTAPVPPETGTGASPAKLRGIKAQESQATVSSGLMEIASAVQRAGRVDDDDTVLEALDAAQMILTGLAVEAAEAEEGPPVRDVQVVRRRYDGLCNQDIWLSSLRCAQQALESGAAKLVIVGALGLWSPRVNDNSNGFGGDSGIVTVLQKDNKPVTFELRPRSEW